MDAARVGELAGRAEVELLGQISLGVELVDLDARVAETARVLGPHDGRDGQALGGLLAGARATLGGSHAGDDKDRRGYAPRVSTCLVTGGAGFLGSHLCDELLAR